MRRLAFMFSLHRVTGNLTYIRQGVVEDLNCNQLSDMEIQIPCYADDAMILVDNEEEKIQHADLSRKNKVCDYIKRTSMM